jgi:type VII secretion integral membrane protein EccD
MTTATSAVPTTEAPRLCKIALLVGEDTLIDYALPAGVASIAVIEDLIPRVNGILRKRGAATLDETVVYHLCRADATRLDPQRSLDDSRVYDGDLLWLLPAEACERFAPVVEEVSTALARSAGQQFGRVGLVTTRRVAGGLCIALVGWSELMLAQLWWQRNGWVPAAVSWALAVVLLVSAWLAARARDEQRRQSADAFVWAALVAAGAAAVMSVPGPPCGWHVVAAIATVLAGVAAWVMLTGRYVAVLAGMTVTGLSAGTVSAIHASGWQVSPAHLAVVFLVAALVLVTFAASLGVVGSGVPGPWFPSVTNRGLFETAADAPRNTVSPVEPSGAPTVEQVAAWARRGNTIVTGLLAGAAAVLVVAARYAVMPQTGGGWRYLVFTLAICAIFLLRARAFVDRYQSVILAVAAVAAVSMVIGRYASAPTPASTAVTLWCVAATLGLAVMGWLAALVIPKARINAPVNRAVEVSEYVLLIFVVPWAIWLLGLLSVVRNAVHGS